jgi:hypothetical protein
MNTQPKSLFSSSIFWSILILLYQATSPNVTDILKSGFTPEKGVTLIGALLTAALGITQRVGKGDIYTPKYVPGADKEEVEARLAVINTPAPTLVDKVNSLAQVAEEVKHVTDTTKKVNCLLSLVAGNSKGSHKPSNPDA